MPVLSMTSISPGSTSRTYSAPMRSNAHGSLATTCASFFDEQKPEAERPDAHRIAHGDDRLLRQEEQRVGALDPRERVGDAVLDGDLLARRDQVHEHLGVGVALEDRAARLELGAELVGVRQVAVVADGERAAGVVDGDRLRVLDVRAAGGRVAHVPDGDAPGSFASCSCVKASCTRPIARCA